MSRASAIGLTWEALEAVTDDALVLLSPQRPDRALAWLDSLMARLGLALHPEKTRMLDARREPFVFLGHTLW